MVTHRQHITKNTGKLTMRYLLTFLPPSTGQLRRIDSAQLGQGDSLHPRNLPAALGAKADVTLGWLMGRHDFGAFRPAGNQPIRPDTPGQITVYALDPDKDAAALGDGYYGAWLDGFLLSATPLGTIAAHPAPQAAMSMLQARAAAPLHSTQDACRKTLEKLRESRAERV